MTTHTSLLLASLLIIPCLSTNTQARVNIVNTGLSLSYDFDDRQYEDRDDDEYQSIAITPQIHFISTGIKDRFEIQASPSIKYDLIDSETNWDNDLLLAAERGISKNWRLIGSNSLRRSDNYESSSSFYGQTTQDNSPELSADFGRSRYWRNTFDLTSEHLYGQQNALDFGFNYIILRNDESEERTYEDYDRYTGSITNQHRFNQKWQTVTDFSVVKGEFEDTGSIALLTEEESLSDDLMEYRLLLTGENNFSRQITLSLFYNYIGTRYDEDVQVDGDIHQVQFRGVHNYSRQTTITLGVGPSYEKSEGLDANIGGNGIAEFTHRSERGSFTFGVEKLYDVDNFSGTNERGFVDSWETHLLADYQILSDLVLDGYIRYTYEDRDDLPTSLSDSLTSTDPSGDIILEEYHNDIFVSGIGLRYNFLRNYTASLDYTFSKQESDRLGKDYDDHRILVSLSWAQDILRW
ncbi:MAG: hypothetical protein ACI8PB_003010 [Desulforhopalus sp.]|jgi:hypothetical protein